MASFKAARTVLGAGIFQPVNIPFIECGAIADLTILLYRFSIPIYENFSYNSAKRCSKYGHEKKD
jgi:hypothetical protein